MPRVPRHKTRKRKKASSIARHIFRWAIVMGVLALVLVGAVSYYLWMHQPHIVLHDEAYPIIGVDLSKHNGDVDFGRLVDDGITFVYLKASEGNDYVDPKFKGNYTSARDAGMTVGAYHYFRMAKNGTVQAYNFLSVIADMPLDLPLAIDVEDWGNDPFVDYKDAQNRLATMVKCLKDSGYKVVIYTNGNGYKKYVKDSLADEMLWICSFRKPKEVTDYNWTFLQYSHWGEVKGISGDVDMDVFNGDRNAWRRWLQAL